MNPKLKTQLKDTGARIATAVHKELYRRSGGRIGNRIGKLQHLLLTTTGAGAASPAPHR
ncbi:MAG TPA: hypothetical protein VGL92_07750 [Acidimicrobiia bacterium]